MASIGARGRMIARALPLATLLAGCAGKQTSSAVNASVTAIVAVEEIPELSIRVGETATVQLRITVAEGYHVQANPASDEFLLPLRLELPTREGFEFGAPAYPKGMPHRLQGADSDLLTYDGSFAVTIPITATGAGEFEIAGRLAYQACNSSRCLFPTSLPIAFRLIARE